MHRRITDISLAVGMMILLTQIRPTAARGQAVLQQPVIGQFGVQTTVSVPDRGAAYLGGLQRAGATRTSFGPWRPGTSTGLFRDSQSITSHVTIHDFQTMDRLLLDQARPRATHRSNRLTGQAAAAYDTLTARQRPRSPVSPAPRTNSRATNSQATNRCVDSRQTVVPRPQQQEEAHKTEQGVVQGSSASNG